MRCKICGKENEIIGYERDDPLLTCLHLQTNDPHQLLVEEAAYDMEQEVARTMTTMNLTREAALDFLVRRDLPKMSKHALVSMMRTLSDAGISSEALEDEKRKLSRSSQRYIKRQN